MPKGTGIEVPGGRDHAAIGRAVQPVIGRLLAQGARDPRPRQLLSYTATEERLNETGAYKLAARATVTALAAVYFRYFVPTDGWGFVGAEVALGPGALDLVFERASDGLVVADELKTGAEMYAACRNLSRKTKRGLTGGARVYGERFGGIRVLRLSVPTASVFVDSSGAGRPLDIEEFHA